MTRNKIIWLCIIALLAIPAISDSIRYLKSDADNKLVIQPYGSFPINNANEMVMVYNAWGGNYPGLADIIHKEVFPKTYPCNLCYQAFGTFGIKKEWRKFIDSLPFQKTELHKDDFKRKYKPDNLQLPVILLRNANEVQVLASAQEIDQYESLEGIKQLVLSKLDSNK
jgi:hypothetical protein